jgi:hypothetical protein
VVDQSLDELRFGNWPTVFEASDKLAVFPVVVSVRLVKNIISTDN